VCALGLVLGASSAPAQQAAPDNGAQQAAPDGEAQREQEALKRARILRIVGIPGHTPSLARVLGDLGASVTGEEARIELATEALFAADSAELRPEASALLQKAAAVLREFPAAPIEGAHPPIPATIEAYGDGTRSADEDQALAHRRAVAVGDWLVENAAIDPARFTLRGLPAAPRGDGRAGGRVEITVKKTSP
jgi:outer membrane protein OmpA-like peptidoglycan-associated protein